jgi:hypothetical protein
MLASRENYTTAPETVSVMSSQNWCLKQQAQQGAVYSLFKLPPKVTSEA